MTNRDHDARIKLQEKIIAALDDDLPLTTNVAALAFVLCRCAHIKGMPRDKFVNAIAATYDVVTLHDALTNQQH